MKAWKEIITFAAFVFAGATVFWPEAIPASTHLGITILTRMVAE